MGLGWLRLRWFLLLAYGLLWVLSLAVILRPSLQPEILGWWSRRAFVLVLMALAAMLGMTVLLGLAFRPESGLARLIVAVLDFLRRRRAVLWLAAVVPPLGWLTGLFFLGWLDVPLTMPIVIGLSAIMGLVILWELALLLAERPRELQRELVPKTALLIATVLGCLIGIEVAGRMAPALRFASWRINPRGVTSRFHTQDFDVSVVTNQQGLREPEVVAERSGDEYRIVVIGDSMTFGWGVEYEDAYPYVLQEKLRTRLGRQDVRVINMGRPGADLSAYLTFAGQYANRLNPRIVVVGFLIGNDCPILAPASWRDEAAYRKALAGVLAAGNVDPGERLLQRSCLATLLINQAYRGAGLMRASYSEGQRGPVFGEANPLDPVTLDREIQAAPDPERSRRILDRMVETSWYEKGRNWQVSPWLLRSVILHPTGPADSLVTREPTARAMQQEWSLCEAVLHEMDRTVTAAGARLVIFGIPAAHAVSERSVRFLGDLGCEINDRMTSSQTINQWLAEFAGRDQIPLIDATARFRSAIESEPNLYFASDDHMTPQGHQLLAEVLAEGLAEQIGD